MLTTLFMNGKALGLTPIAVEDAESDLFTSNDLKPDWNTSSATKIVLSDQGSTISGNGAYVYDGNIHIIYAGRYVLTGSLSNGSVIIDADKNDKIWVSLDGAAIHCEDSAAIRIEQADKVFLTLADGSKNTVSSGSEYNAEVTASGVDGAIYSRDDLTINGSGALVVETGYCHGIVCNDDLVITGGDIAVTAAQDGIHANDSVRIRSASLSISAGDDGITVSNDDETAFLHVESGNITIPACYEGMEAINITITGGTIDIAPTDDGINANGNGSNSVIRITGGDVTIINPDGRDADGLDSNGSIYIEGGNIFISVSDSGGSCALDYGSENGGECIISGGTVIACGGSMMAEGFDESSPQGFLMYSTNAAAGSTISLEDSTGKVLLSEEIPCGFSSAVLSTPELSIGDTCIISIDGVQEEITIDNSSTSGFGPVGMFGGGMRGGRGRDGMNSGQEDNRRPFFDGQEGKEPQSGMPQDFPARPDDQDFSPQQGMEPPDGMEEFPVRPDMPGGGDWADRQEIEPPGDMEESPAQPDISNGGDWANRQEIEPPGDMEEPPTQPDISNSGDWADRQEMGEAGERPFAPGTGTMPEDGTRPLRQDWGQMTPEEDSSSSNLSADTWILLGISVLTLLAGLFIAHRVKHFH